MQIIRLTLASFKPDDLRPATKTLQGGGVIAYPTETVYGLGADMWSATGVDKVFRLKQRDASKPISVMIATTSMAAQLCQEVPKYADALMRRCWPGPITLILKAAAHAPQYVLSVDGKIGLRMPDHPVTAALVESFGSPITCTSANLSGQPPLRRADDVIETFKSGVDLVIDAGMSPPQEPSTVVDASSSTPRILRHGSITQDQIEKVIRGVAE